MHHYVDGYNLLFALFEEPDEHDLRGQREALLELVNDFASSVSAEITIVFDARVAPASSRYQRGAIEVAYTDEATDADDWIVEHIDYRSGESVVVTNDRRLANRCRRLGAAVKNPEAWLRWLRKKAQKKRKEIPLPQPTREPRKEKKVSHPKVAPEDPRFLQRLEGESEIDRWCRIFESRMNEPEV